MRARIAAVILLTAGIALAADALIGDRRLSPPQLDMVRTVCPECHGDVPEYGRVARVHRKHAAFECSFCHRDQGGLKTTDNVHAALERVGLGAMLLASLGIIANVLTTRRRAKRNP